jgi:dynein heavy chain, axonemal
LGIFFDWFVDGFERLSKEGQEAKWRPLCEGETENYPLPTPLEQLEPIQKFCIIRALRNDRLTQASTVYINNVFSQE